jgi:hypothetical protein
LRFLCAALIVTAIGVPIVATLLARVPDVQDSAIVTGAPGWVAAPVDLGVAYLPDGVKRARVALWQDEAERLLAHPEIRFVFATYDAAPALVRGELRLAGTECVYRTRPDAAIINNAYLAFERTDGCSKALSGQTSRRLDLIVTFRGPGRLGLAAYFVPRSAFDRKWISFTDPDTDQGTPMAVVRGRYVDYGRGPAVPRVELLAYMWQVSHSTAWLWEIVGFALLLVFVSLVLLGAVPRPRLATLARAAGVGALGLGLALLYVVFVPPLQGPDEPDHMLGFASVAGRPDLAEGTAALARTGHFARLRFHGGDRFRPADIGHPLATAWGVEVFTPDVAGRSTTTCLWWKLIAPLVRSFGAAWSLLTLRLCNALLFGVALAIATVLLTMIAGDAAPVPHAVVLALLMLPTLPFFATHVSEFAVLTSTYVVLAGIVAAMVLDGRRVYLLGLPLGLTIAAILGGGRSGLPLVAFFGAVAAGRLLLGSPPTGTLRDDRRQAVIFWAGMGLGLATFELLSTPQFRAGLWPGDAGRVPAWFRQAAEFLRRWPASVLVFAPVGFALDCVIAAVRRRLGSPPALARSLVRLVCYAGAAAIACSLIASAFITYPALDTIEISPPAGARAYAIKVLAVALSGVRLSHHDLLLSSSFWAGFGWIDTLPGDRFVSLVVLLSAAAAVATLVLTARTRNVRRTLWFAVLAGGCLAALVFFALSSYYVQRNLHGRYLVGLYLSILGVCWSSAALLPRTPALTRWCAGLNREWLLAMLVAGIHVWALRFILLRYF